MRTKSDGPAIRHLREAKGLSNADLADLAGVSRPFMWRIENGERNGGAAVHYRIAQALEVDVPAITISDNASVADRQAA